MRQDNLERMAPGREMPKEVSGASDELDNMSVSDRRSALAAMSGPKAGGSNDAATAMLDGFQLSGMQIADRNVGGSAEPVVAASDAQQGSIKTRGKAEAEKTPIDRMAESLLDRLTYKDDVSAELNSLTRADRIAVAKRMEEISKADPDIPDLELKMDKTGTRLLDIERQRFGVSKDVYDTSHNFADNFSHGATDKEDRTLRAVYEAVANSLGQSVSFEDTQRAVQEALALIKAGKPLPEGTELQKVIKEGFEGNPRWF